MKKGIALVLIFWGVGVCWDGQRQGFILGAGMGTASNVWVNFGAESGEVLYITWFTPAGTSRIGYAWDNLNAIELYGTDVTSTFGYMGINYQKWNIEKVQANSWFGGAGFLRESNSSIGIKDEDPPVSDFGFGFNFGYAREVVKHTSVDMNFILGFIETEFFNSIENQMYTSFTMTVNLTGY